MEKYSIGTKIIILVVIAVLIIGAIIFGFLYFRNAGQEPVEPGVIDETKPPAREQIVPVENRPAFDLPEMTAEEKGIEQAQNIAKIFAERFGSFSNQGSFSNLDDLAALSTPQMQDWLVAQKKKLSAQYAADEVYYGVTTIAPIAKIESQSDSSAVIIVSTQRKETKDGEIRVFNQDLKLAFVKVNGEWLINAAYWQ